MGRHSKDEPLDVTEAIAERISTGTSTGYHRAIGQAPRRGIAKWLIASVAVFVLLGAGGFVLTWGNDVFNSPAEASNDCPEGHRTLRVVTAPKVFEVVNEVGRAWNAADRVVHSHCVAVEVSHAYSHDVLKDLRTPSTVRAVPAVWIPEITHWAERLRESHPDRVPGAAQPLVTKPGASDYPYVVVGGAGVDDVQERAAQAFRQFLLKSEQISALN